MRILLELSAGSDGRLTGTAAGPDPAGPLPFSGNLELLARVEQLAQAAQADPTRPTEPHPDPNPDPTQLSERTSS
jgi:hypothetical protein